MNLHHDNPKEKLRSWMPHLVLVGILLLALWLVLAVFRPLWNPLLLAAALASLTYPVLFEPLLKGTGFLRARLSPYQHRGLCGVCATIILVMLMASPAALLLINVTGSIEGMAKITVGVMTRNQEKIQVLMDLVKKQAVEFRNTWPQIPVDPEQVSQYSAKFIREASNFAPAYLSYLFRGTGGFVAQLVLALIALSFFYAEGPGLIRRFLRCTPLSETEASEFMSLFRRHVLRLLTDTVAAALLKGLLLGLAIWVFTGINFFIVAVLATFISLIPVVGSMVVWLPAASFLWTRGEFGAAALLAMLCVCLDAALEIGRWKLGQRLHDRSVWTGFLLFLSIIGGLLGFGIQGLVIGPMVVVLIAVIGRFWLPLYGMVSWKEDKQDQGTSA